MSALAIVLNIDQQVTVHPTVEVAADAAAMVAAADAVQVTAAADAATVTAAADADTVAADADAVTPNTGGAL